MFQPRPSSPMPATGERRRRRAGHGLALVALLLAGGCGKDRGELTLQLPHHSDLRVDAPVTLDGHVVGTVTHLKRAKTGNKAVAILAVDTPALAQLDPQSLFVVRPIRYGESKQQVVVSNLCAAQPRGLKPRATVAGYGGLISQILPRIARQQEACMKRLGETSFAQLRKAFAVPGG